MAHHLAGKLAGPVTKWVVVVAWIVVVLGSSTLAAKLTDVQDNQSSSFLPGDAESTKALAEIAPFQDPDDIATSVVYRRDSGLTAADLASAKQQAAAFADLDGVTGKVVGPTVSQDGQVAQTLLTYNFGAKGFEKMSDAADDLRAASQIDGVQVYVGGQGGQAADSIDAFSGIDGVLLFGTLAVVVVILLLTYRSPVLWILPIISAVTALQVAQAVIYLLARYADLTVNGQSAGILTVLVVGAGTDYALLIVARYREELHRHEDRHEAMAVALHRAVPPILASAATVAAGLLCLLFADLNSTAGLGPVVAIGVVATFVVMVTLLPALLVVFGRRIFWPRKPRVDDVEPSQAGVWARVGRRIAVRPRAVWVSTTLVLGVLCLGLVKVDAHGLSNEESFTKDFDSIVAQRTLEEHGLLDTANTILVVTRAASGDTVREAMAGVDDIGTVSPPIVQGDTALVVAVVEGDPASRSAYDQVRAVREAVHAVPGADALVGGNTAINLDIQDAAGRDGRVIIPIVLLVVLLILMLLLRAVVAALVLIATVVLSFGAALGISSLIFTYVFGFAGTDAAFPLFVFVFLVALGIDYNIFLMTRVREETAALGTREGSLVALAATGGVITSAGLVLAATFAVLGTLPFVFFAELGTAVALGVLLDTLVVRSVLVTAINLDLGSRVWWPSRLDRGPHAAGPAADGRAGGTAGRRRTDAD